MAASFSSRENHVRQLGKDFESDVAKGDPLPRSSFELILRLPRVEMPFLKDTIFSLCEARLGGGSQERASRLQDAGASLIRFLGLTFDSETINREFVPRVIDSAESVIGLPLESLESRISRYERISALAQLAPRIADENVDDVFKATLGMAGYQGAFHPDLLLPLANFERVYRSRILEGEESDAARCRYLCLESVRGVLETTVEALADADQASLSEAMSILPLVHTAGLSLLTILPSVARVGDAECASKMGEILDHSEWLLSRHEQFPGNYVKREEVAMFDRVRGMLSLSVGLLSLYSERYKGAAREMKVAKREGSHRLGTAVLHLARYADPSEALEVIRGLVVEELRIDASGDGRLLNREAIMETGALAWHIDVGDSPEIRGVFQLIRDPRCQFYLTKTMEGAPWGEDSPR